ncbi:MAG TPA: amylo-alpha-1,6-glucosidase [Treponemataceae bacterium]|nr:amylo-alpha-1,6-glucosidase [Treponemataceae bacterium]
MNFPCALSISADSGMCVSFTDRISTFMHFHSDAEKQSYGIVRGDAILLKDFCFIDSAGKIITRASCTKMTARCGSLEFVFPSFSFFISLLFTGRDYPVLCIRYVPDNCSSAVFPVPLKLVLLAGSSIVCEEAEKDEKEILKKEFLSDAIHPFIFSGLTHASQIFYVSFLKKSKAQLILQKENYTSGLMHNHRYQIEQFFTDFSFSVSSLDAQENNKNNVFCKALLWAQFSGWMMVTGVHERGIWAGLPWFRDNWGRDTFIALPGILLVSGQFEEARNVIESFAEYQNVDEESESYGKIPNRYRSDADVIYNTADGTLWFIRELWEYIQYTADIDFLKKMFPVVQRALEADRTLRCDTAGFLTHGDADTWMDARIENNEPWSPRGNRACDIQALWYTALTLGSCMASFCGNLNDEKRWNDAAQKVKANFSRFFIYSKPPFIADCLHPDGLPDMSLRPNQLFCTTVPNLSGLHDEADHLIDESMRKQSIHTVFENLVFPYGITSLDQNHENFHPYHDSCPMYHKDASYHNGTIWLWNSGPAVEAACMINEQDSAYELSLSHAKLMLPSYSKQHTGACAGSLSENMDAYRNKGAIHLSGTFSQSWSLSEFSRTAYTSYAGIHPCLISRRIIISPSFPSSWKSGRINFRAGELLLTLVWKTEESTEKVLFTLSSRPVKKGSFGHLQISVCLAQEKGSRAYKKDYTLLPEGSCSFSGFIVKRAEKISFAVPAADDRNKKSIAAISEENYLYNKIKGMKL